ncbi:hypothetical protein [Streptomyces sp. MST-110588]|uniref:hypothetical protein n=1 Tax=Streptomyces sp. MST-110588 TaxID=2833628 RepID=UPI001F5D812D|nr:hypothetical protein [Streptomyces sp. MST-110588]UNO40569.1 hypothetical protein KGS77_14505 [Streptomyces sp. MST-110588]
MDRYQGVAHLEWWANARTRLMRLPVEVTTAVDGATLMAVASPPLRQVAREELLALVDADPQFVLRMDDDTVMDVVVEQGGDAGRLLLRSVPGV